MAEAAAFKQYLIFTKNPAHEYQENILYTITLALPT